MVCARVKNAAIDRVCTIFYISRLYNLLHRKVKAHALSLNCDKMAHVRIIQYRLSRTTLLGELRRCTRPFHSARRLPNWRIVIECTEGLSIG